MLAADIEDPGQYLWILIASSEQTQDQNHKTRTIIANRHTASMIRDRSNKTLARLELKEKNPKET